MIDINEMIWAIVRNEMEDFFRRNSAQPKPETDKKILDPREVEGAFGLKATTLANFRTRGIGPAYTKIGASVLYQRKDIENFLKKRRFKTYSRED
jgi:hypothetical protein